jgi:hypothetical protein
VHLPLGSEEARLRYAHNIIAALVKAHPDRVVISTSGQIIDNPGSPLQHPDDAALPTLVRGVAAAGLPHAVIAARTFLDNLLLPVVLAAIRAEGVLRYPIRADLPISWSSHLDVADVAVALLEHTDVTGLVAVGQYPPIRGRDLAESFSVRLGRQVAYEAVAPEKFGETVAPLIGDAGAAAVVARYKALASLRELTFEPGRSAQQRLSVTPRTTGQWLDELDI